MKKTNLNKKLNKGFTLIELLVVIAIIGSLSAIVLAQLNTARNKGADTSIKATMSNIRAQAEIYYDDPEKGNGTYGISSTCPTSGTFTGMFSDGVIKNAIDQIKKQNGNKDVTCSTDSAGQLWAVSSPLKTTGTWCVDNSGFVGTGTVNGTTGKCS